ncbi:MAG: hypothetical protein NDJ92_02645 [Thermoanaerobaculia bacterium]|nr:hypothetical protein [Thermoanaerobaculia bacterium]
MLLVVSHSQDETANYLCRKLRRIGRSLVRLDTDCCTQGVEVTFSVGNPSILIDGVTVSADEVDHVWLRRPKFIEVAVGGDPAERLHVANEWSEAIEGYLAHIPVERWMNHPTRNVLASHKMEQLTRAAAFGLNVPRTIVTQSPESVRTCWKDADGRLIAKPLASGFLERDDGKHTSIYTTRVRELDGASAESIRICPTLFQEEITKAFDVRLTWVDGHACAVALHRENASEPDVRRDNMRAVTYRVITIPADVERNLGELLRWYGLRFAAVDFGVTDEGRWVFFEINPNGQWAWLDLVGATALWEDFADAFAP